jgi:uncharacterized protein
MIEIDHRQLPPETLNNVLTEIVLRAGTDYGEQELSLEDKKRQLRSSLDSGHSMIVFYAAEGFCDVVQKINEV